MQRCFACSLAVAFVVSSTASAERPTHAGMTALFGNLHAHSSLSDDVDKTLTKMTPAEAYDAAFRAGLDFFAVSDHHKASDAGNPIFSLTAAEYASIVKAAKDFNTAHPNQFVALPAIEWGNGSTGNHVNVVAATALPPGSVLNVDYDELYAWAATNGAFIQLNHPNSWSPNTKNKMVGNFGEKRFTSTSAFVGALNKVARAVSIICTVGGGHLTGAHKDSTKKTHRRMQWENHYRKLLNMGARISPSADQDTHTPNFGTVTAARTGVWTNTITRAGVLDGFNRNRVFATEDDELAVAMQVSYGGRIYWMGELVPLAAEEDDVELLVFIQQGTGSDNDPTDEGPYTVTVNSDDDGIGGRQATVWQEDTGVAAGAVHRIPLRVLQGEYIYVSVREEGGKDNPEGDGEDEDGDGKRDNLNDGAWTSPVWFTESVSPPSGPNWVWSRTSKVFHDPDCWVVKQIGAANREAGADPGSRTKHNCHP